MLPDYYFKRMENETLSDRDKALKAAREKMKWKNRLEDIWCIFLASSGFLWFAFCGCLAVGGIYLVFRLMLALIHFLEK